MSVEATLMYDEMIRLCYNFAKQSEAERIYIYCNPAQHATLLIELNRLLDSVPYPAKAALIPVPEVPVGKLYVTKRKYADYEYQEFV